MLLHVYPDEAPTHGSTRDERTYPLEAPFRVDVLPEVGQLDRDVAIHSASVDSGQGVFIVARRGVRHGGLADALAKLGQHAGESSLRERFERLERVIERFTRHEASHAAFDEETLRRVALEPGAA